MKVKKISSRIFIITFLLHLSFLNITLFENVSSADAQEETVPSDVILVLDNSGSMKKNDPDFLAKDVVTRSLIDLGSQSRLGMVVFDSQAKLAANLMETESARARAKILSSLNNMNYKGLFSDTPAAIERAIYELKSNGREDARKIIILLTDGIVDTGDKQRDVEKTTWLKDALAEECSKSGIKIMGVAFTENADFSLIQTLAVKTDGEYFRAYKAEDIQGIFNQIKEIVSRPEAQPAPSTTRIVEVGEMKPAVEEEIESLDSVVKTAEPPAPGIGTKTMPEKEAAPPQKSGTQWPMIFGGIVLLGIIAIGAIYYQRSKGDKDISGGEVSKPDIPRAVLIDVNNITGNKTYTLGKKINMIGRDPNNDIVIEKDTVSSFHAVIEYRDGFFYLEDQRSMNKTSLSGEDIAPNSPRRLKSGDEVMFNIYRFKFMLPDTIPSGKTVVDFHAPSETMVRKRDDKTDGELPALPKAILVDVENITGKKTVRLKKRLSKIGRGSGNDIEISEESVSGLHAVIEYKDGFFYLEDQRSKNKTKLAGEDLEPQVPKKLKSGDEIIFDIYKFIFMLEYELPSGDTGDRTVELKS